MNKLYIVADSRQHSPVHDAHGQSIVNKVYIVADSRQYSPVHDAHGESVVNEFHSARDEEVDILVPRKGGNAEGQTKVACRDGKPAE